MNLCIDVSFQCVPLLAERPTSQGGPTGHRLPAIVEENCFHFRFEVHRGNTQWMYPCLQRLVVIWCFFFSDVTSPHRRVELVHQLRWVSQAYYSAEAVSMQWYRRSFLSGSRVCDFRNFGVSMCCLWLPLLTLAAARVMQVRRGPACKLPPEPVPCWKFRTH